MRTHGPSSLTFVEKDFYLDEFHEKSLLFALRSAELASEADLNAALEVIGTLLTNETMVLLLIEMPAGEEHQRRLKAWHKQLLRLAKTPTLTQTLLPAVNNDEEMLLHIWTALRDGPVFLAMFSALADVAL